MRALSSQVDREVVINLGLREHDGTGTLDRSIADIASKNIDDVLSGLSMILRASVTLIASSASYS